jgi:serine/threonine protein kinase
MNPSKFDAPSLEQMNRLLPAFEFKTLITCNSYRAVYHGQQRSLERDIAIKVLSPEASRDPVFRKDFEKTSQAMALLNHPNLITLFDSGVIEEMIYCVMEFVPGKSLERSARGVQVECPQALELINGIAEGVSHAHEHKILHGSLNLTHILLNQQARPKVGNFGFDRTKISEDEGVSHELSESCVAPELKIEGGNVSLASDIYALGAILYKLLTGHPHSLGGAKPSELIQCSPAVDEIWKKATDPDPSKRYLTARLLQWDLKAAIEAKVAKSQTSPLPAGDAIQPTGAGKAFKPSSFQFYKNLFLKFLIIGLLVVAVKLAWDHKVAKEEEANKAKAHQLALDEEARRVKEQKAREAIKKPTVELTKPVEKQPEAQVEEAPKSLIYLKSKLASGDFSVMPEGTIRKGHGYYLLVNDLMTWPEATYFAEQYGGHIAIPDKDVNLAWLIEQFAQGKDMWIGAGKSSQDQWVLSDGTVWNPADVPVGSGVYLAVDKKAQLRAGLPAVKLPFVLQWSQQSRQRGALEVLLAKTKKSIDLSAPVYPPGTIQSGSSHYLWVARSVNWEQANEFAKKAGAQLAVAASSEEWAQVSKVVDGVSLANGVWLGATKQDGHWAWLDGSQWKEPKWQSGTQLDGDYIGLLAISSQGLSAKPMQHVAAGFILEWAPAAAQKTTTPVGVSKTVNGLRKRAQEILVASDVKRSKDLIANNQKYQRAIDAYLKKLSSGEQNIERVNCERMKQLAKEGRLPEEIPVGYKAIEFNSETKALLLTAVNAQKALDVHFSAGAEKTRAAYVARTKDDWAKAEISGQKELAGILKLEMNAATDLTVWAASLGVIVDPPAVTAIERD